MRTALRLRGMSYRTEQTYVDWAKRFIKFHNFRHPREMGAPEAEGYGMVELPFALARKYPAAEKENAEEAVKFPLHFYCLLEARA